MNNLFPNLNNFVSEFEWILDVLKSCENYEQVRVTTKLFENFNSKWNDLNVEYFEIFEKNRIEFETEKLKMFVKIS